MKRSMLIRSLSIISFAMLSTAAESQNFTEVGQSSGIDQVYLHPGYMGGGAAFFDYDNDGFDDIYITGGMIRDHLYHNNGNGTFTEVGANAGLDSTAVITTMGVITGDIDNDGFKDVFVTTENGKPDLLYQNNGNGTFTEIFYQDHMADTAMGISATFGDYNLDGYLDIYVVNYFNFMGPVQGLPECGPSYFYINNGNATFTEMAAAYGIADTGCGLAVAFTDYDFDHDIDIYIANDFGMLIQPNVLFQNDYPADGFTDVSAASGADAIMYGMGIAIGDYDEDTDLDYYATNLGRNVLLNNQGDGTFGDSTDIAGVANTLVDTSFATGWGTAFFDYDLDTYLDLFVTNGYVPAMGGNDNALKNPNRLYHNNADGTFDDVTFAEAVSDSSLGRGFACGDYDNDGDIDLLVMNISLDTLANRTPVLLYENTLSNGSHWLKVKLQGTRNNRDGFGSRIRIVAGGRQFIREIDGGSSHLSNSSSTAHFGLANLTTVDSVIVTWLGGCRQVMTNVAVDQMLTIVEEDPNFHEHTRNRSICAGDSILAGGQYQHTEGSYIDTVPVAGYCDSLVTTNLTVTQPVQHSIDTSMDHGSSYHGHMVTSDTTLMVHLTAASGCDSIVTANISLTGGSGIASFVKVNGIKVVPNPFTGETTISYHMSRPGQVSIDIYTVFGEKVKTLVNEYQPAGQHTAQWKGVSNDLLDMPTGVYLCKIRVDEQLSVARLLLMRTN